MKIEIKINDGQPLILSSDNVTDNALLLQENQELKNERNKLRNENDQLKVQILNFRTYKTPIKACKI